MDSHRNDFRTPLPPPRFSLATMFWAIGMLAAAFAAMTYLGAYATLLFALFAAAIVAHVAGNALGTKLRDGGAKMAPSKKRAAAVRQRVEATDFAPTTKLQDRYGLGWAAVFATLAGAVCGGLLGGIGLTLLMTEITLSAVSLAVIASTVLGAIWAFAAASFLQVGYGAAREATSEVAAREESATSSACAAQASCADSYGTQQPDM